MSDQPSSQPPDGVVLFTPEEVRALLDNLSPSFPGIKHDGGPGLSAVQKLIDSSDQHKADGELAGADWDGWLSGLTEEDHDGE